MQNTQVNLGDTSASFLKLCLARYIYRKGIAENLTPSSQRTTSDKKKKTWAEHFERTHGENLYAFIKRKQEEKQNGQSKED